MSDYRFSIVVPSAAKTHDAILDAADAIAKEGCTDASLRGHEHGMELLFERSAESLQAAIVSAVSDVERAGFRVSRVELERETLEG